MTGQVHYAGHELGVMAAGRGQKRDLIDAEGGDPDSRAGSATSGRPWSRTACITVCQPTP
jgi:hypothetical protein